MASDINVAPVTGMTPKQVATELRSLIRDQIWQGLKGMNGGKAKGKKVHPHAKQNHEFVIGQHAVMRDSISQVNVLLDEMNLLATLRRPNQIRNQTKKISVLMAAISNARGYEMDYANWAFNELLKENIAGNTLSPSEGLMQAAQRAYALVQALPTVDGAPVGQAENTLRAITAMVKVYHGVEVQGTVEKLPEMMPQLLAAIKPPEPEEQVQLEQTVPAPQIEFKLEAAPSLPWAIYGSVDKVSGWAIEVTKKGPKALDDSYGPPTKLIGGSAGFNGGHCDALTALKTLVGLRQNFSDKSFSLRDSKNYVYAVAYPGKPIQTYLGFGDVLYHLRKETEAHAKGQKGVALSDSIKLNF